MPTHAVLAVVLLAALFGAPSAVFAADADPLTDRQGADVAEESEAPSSFLVTMLLLGLAGVAAVAFIGTATVLAGRRRRSADDHPPATTAVDVTATMDRRAVRRSKVRLGDDPIVAASGSERTRRRDGVHHGPGR